MPAIHTELRDPDSQNDVYCHVLVPGQPTTAVQLLARSETSDLAERGAVVTFEGIVRQTENGRALEALDYDYHPVMAQQELTRVCQLAYEQFGLLSIAC